MKSFTYTIQDKLGIHARPAGLLVKKAREFSSQCTLEMNGKQAELTKLFAVMGLGVTCGSAVTVSAEVADEVQAIAGLENFFKDNL